MPTIRRLWLTVITTSLILSYGLSVSAQEHEVSSMTCVISGKASSTFWFQRQGTVREGWSGKDPYDAYGKTKAYPRFDVQVPVDREWFTEMLFSKLDSPNPVVRPIFADRAGIEAQTVVLDRRPDILVIMFRWGTTWHSVVINFKVRKAAISGVASDTVGVSGSVWTADCK